MSFCSLLHPPHLGHRLARSRPFTSIHDIDSTNEHLSCIRYKDVQVVLPAFRPDLRLRTQYRKGSQGSSRQQPALRPSQGLQGGTGLRGARVQPHRLPLPEHRSTEDPCFKPTMSTGWPLPLQLSSSLPPQRPLRPLGCFQECLAPPQTRKMAWLPYQPRTLKPSKLLLPLF